MALAVKQAVHQTPTGPRQADEEGYHHVSCHDGVSIRFRLLLGGPDGNHRVNPNKRLAICLHGLGDSMKWWEDAVFRTKPLPASYTPFSVLPDAPSAAELLQGRKQDAKRRAKLTKWLAKHVNVALVDVRGFGGSGRPCSELPIEDMSVTLLYTYKVNDVGAFTNAVRADMEASRLVGGECHSMALAGSKACVCVTFPDGQLFARWLSQHLAAVGSEKDRKDATLVELLFTGPDQEVKNLEYWPAEFTGAKELTKLTKVAGSFKMDRLCGKRPGSELIVVHHLNLSQEDSQLVPAFEECVEEMSDDASCLSFSISHCSTRAVLVAAFSSPQEATAYCERAHGWFKGNPNDVVGRCCEIAEAQVHARASELKALPPPSDGLRLFQAFPLSFQGTEATEASATLHDFVRDVQSILDYCGAPRAAIVGHSMGAAIALQHLVAHPGSVERLCTSAGAPRVGQAAKAQWMAMAGAIQGWRQNVIRSAVSVANIEDAAFHGVDVPTLLINAADDGLTPLVGSQLLKSALPHALLEVPEFGGHDCLVINDEPFERMVRFIAADEAMVFADDPLFCELAASPWNLAGDAAFVRYYELGVALSRVEAAERRLRLVRNFERDGEHEDGCELREKMPAFFTQEQLNAKLVEIAAKRTAREQIRVAEEEALAAALTSAGVQVEQCRASDTPRGVLLGLMTEQLGRMSRPARRAVEAAGFWWRDSGKAAEGYAEGKYTVDAWGRRRGASKRHNCAWYRWDLSCVPPALREGHAYRAVAEAADSEMFQCWWCGGAPADYEDLGPADPEEEPGFYPGVGPGRRPWRRPAPPEAGGIRLADEEEEGPELHVTEPSRGGPAFQRVCLY